ncbi:MAG: hypothetical protein IIZ98_06535 [Erysipelotrichaceae bacterium]|nr:hypothetical protein [Erysipelotrichaceae bacterium]
MAYLTLNFDSKYLGGNHSIGVILPDRPFVAEPRSFYENGRKYKVLWLLHGTFGDHSDWIRKSLIETYACERDLVVVMPSALNSVYENWPDFGIGFNMWDYFFDELMPLIYNWFPVSDKREDNYIAGLSMGGRGTMKYVCAHPELFAGAAVLSSCPRDLRAEFESDLPQSFKDRIQNDIDRCGGMENYLNSAENTWDHCRSLVNDPLCPKLYFACGEDDASFKNWSIFREYAKEIGLKAEFVSEPGYQHEWRFWDKYIELALDYLEIERKKHEAIGTGR